MSHAPDAPADLLEIARECQRAVNGMTPEQLDDWYEQNVGRRLLSGPDADEELIDEPLQHRALVAGMMLYHRLPQGVDTPGAEAAERDLFAAICEGRAL